MNFEQDRDCEKQQDPVGAGGEVPLWGTDQGQTAGGKVMALIHV